MSSGPVPRLTSGYVATAIAVGVSVGFISISTADTPRTFLCHGDLCTRGVHFCAEDVKRCELCGDLKYECNSSFIPRECDVYCCNLQVKILKEKNHGLHQENTRLKEEVRRLKTEKQDLEISLSRMLNTTIISQSEQLHNFQKLLQECDWRNELLIIFLGLVSAACLLLSVTLCEACRRLRRKRSEISYTLHTEENEQKSLSSSDSDAEFANPDTDTAPDKQSRGPTAEEGVRPSNIPPTSPAGTSLPVYD